MGVTVGVLSTVSTCAESAALLSPLPLPPEQAVKIVITVAIARIEKIVFFILIIFRINFSVQKRIKFLYRWGLLVIPLLNDEVSFCTAFV